MPEGTNVSTSQETLGADFMRKGVFLLRLMVVELSYYHVTMGVFVLQKKVSKFPS
jgi:hypothetical protein